MYLRKVTYLNIDIRRRKRASKSGLMYSLLTLILSLFFSVNSFAANYYRRHYIVLVDQTEDVQIFDSLAFSEAYTFLLDNFVGKDSTFEFDETTDEISLFTFGLPGAYDRHTNEFVGSYRDIHNLALDRKKEEAYNLFSKKLIQNEERFSRQKNYMTLLQFLDSCLHPLFKGESHHFLEILELEMKAVTFSKYVYPVILETGHVNFEKPATEYIIVIASNFQSGLDDIGTSKDYSTLKDMLGEGHVEGKRSNTDYFESRFSSLSKPFYQIPLFKKEYRSIIPNKDARPSVLGYKLGLCSLEGVSVYVASNVNVMETGYEETTYNIDKVRILFNQEDKGISVDSVSMTISCQNDTLYEKTSSQLHFDGIYYESEELKDIELSHVFEVGDSLLFKYVFYARALDSYTNVVIPLVFVAERPFVFNRENIVQQIPNGQNNNIMIVAILIMMFFLFSYLKRRGKYKSISYEWDSHSTIGWFQHIGPDGARLLPCVFTSDEETQIRYTIKGVITNTYKTCIPWKVGYVFIKASKQKAPDGVSMKIANEGNNKWIPIEIKNNEFSFDIALDFSNSNWNRREETEVLIEISTKYIPYFRKPEKVKVSGTNCKSFLEDLFVEDNDLFNNFIEKYKPTKTIDLFTLHNFLRQRFSHPQNWIGIDPGTYASCMTIGYGGTGNIENPQIRRITFGEENEESMDSILTVKADCSEKEVSKWIPGTDYKYGLNAKKDIKESVDNGDYVFRSIKKLIGYKRSGNDGNIHIGKKSLEGTDLQTLLMKALKVELDGYLKNNEGELRNVFNCDGSKPEFERAVVAIPNNYLLPQITDMVKSVKNSGFEEVRFIYEAEGILFHYLKSSLRNIKGKKNIIIFDMGGATINLTTFQIERVRSNDNSDNYIIHTLSRLGYSVGGDDIDYALIEYLMHFQKIADCFKNDAERYEFQKRHKTELVKIVQDFKHGFVKLCLHRKEKDGKTEYEDVPQNLSSLNNFVNILQQIIQIKDKPNSFVEDDLSETEKATFNTDFHEGLYDDVTKFTALKSFVYDKVEEAVEDLMDNQLIGQTKIDGIIFSGRSTLFPLVKDKVINKIADKTTKEIEEYEIGGNLKNVVADGACWYGIYHGKIVTMDNSRITSSYGYFKGGNFEELVKRNTRYEEEQSQYAGQHIVVKSARVNSEFRETAGHVQFYQLMGGIKNGTTLTDESNKHKVRLLTSIDLEGHKAENVSIKVYETGQVYCNVEYQGDSHELQVNFDSRDITDENSRSYIFSVTDIEQHTPKESSNNISNSSNNNAQNNQKPKNQKTDNKKEINYYNNSGRNGWQPY